MHANQSVENFCFDLFYTTVNAYYRTAAVKAAIELGVFDTVGERGKTLAEIAHACASSERGIRILCRFLVSIGFLRSRGDLFFMSREMAMFLDPKSPGYLGGSIEFLLSPYVMDAFSDLTSVVRTGRITLADDGVVAPDHPQWVKFARGMMQMMTLPSMLVAELADPKPMRPIRVLDMAAGHGLFGIEVARRNPEAHVTFLDWDNVLDVARENAAKAGVAERVAFLPGNAFEVELGEGYDVVLLTNFLHHFDQVGCEKILRKTHGALNDDGRVLTFEFIANEDRVSPPLAATFSMMMLGTTPSGEVYTFSDMKKMFLAVGYSRVDLKSIPPAMEKVVVSHY
ncbi:MAG: methyltransferase domain-containing protein [Gammaproteobacteria bacterium]|nr:methyltransferase domain-containing protein [Gammaproteobacteria bacterium]